MPSEQMSDERLAILMSRRGGQHLIAACYYEEIFDALVAERAALAQRTQEWEDERKFIEQIEGLLGADRHGSVGSGIAEAIDKLRAEVKRLEAKLDWADKTLEKSLTLAPMSIETIKARLAALGEVSTTGSIGQVAEPGRTDQNKANVDLLCSARNALPGLIAAVRVAVDALLFAKSETQTVGQEYGLPHVAERADTTLAEIELLLEGEAEAKR